MKPCSCGQLTEDNSTQCARCEAFHVLGLTTDATESEVRKTNRLLLEVWRPDRFQDSPELQQAAEEKLKDIHAASEYLSFTSTERSLQPRPVYATTCKAGDGAECRRGVKGIFKQRCNTVSQFAIDSASTALENDLGIL